jgi:hypothetical protein
MARAGARLLGRALAACAVAGCGASPASAPAVPAAVVPSCPTDRTVVLASQADIARFATCTTARAVTIRSGGKLDTSALRALATITGDLVIGPTVGVEDVTLGELRVVDGAVHVVGNGLMQGLFLPRLERAGRIEIDGNVAITTISLPRLAAVRGAIRITDNANLELVDMPALTAVDQALVLSGDPRLALIDAAQLQTAATVQIDAPLVPPDVAARLRSIAVAR